MSTRQTPPLPPASHPEGLGESAWMNVIHEMDAVDSQLIADEVALAEKNAALEQSQQFIPGLLASLSDGIVEQHGGTLSVASASGQGACFTVALPRQPV